MVAKTAPLLLRGANATIALAAGRSEIDRTKFLSHVHHVADCLPEQRYALNLCSNRYHFLVTFCAVIVRGQTNLLPASRGPGAQQQLFERFDDSYVLHDGCEIAPGLRSMSIPALDAGKQRPRKASTDVPQIPLEQVAAIVFTSGSTGESKPVKKSWRTFYLSSAINHRHMLHDFDHTQHLLATVPGQHMYGLETSILMPLVANIAISDAQPLFPKDVQAALSKLPEPRILVSSPVHLRALVRSGLQFPTVATVLSATAPLDAELAVQVEGLFNARVLEIYGSSETGSMAFRFTSQDEQWTLFDGMQLSTSRQGSSVITADHLPEPVEMNDTLTPHGDRQMTLGGRQTDMINVAGKRGSLQELNRILLTAAGVADGVIFRQESSGGSAGQRGDRLAALVVAEGTDAQALGAHLRKHVDSTFVPRPIYFVHALPREENGKLPRKNILEVFERVRRSGSQQSTPCKQGKN